MFAIDVVTGERQGKKKKNAGLLRAHGKWTRGEEANNLEIWRSLTSPLVVLISWVTGLLG